MKHLFPKTAALLAAASLAFTSAQAALLVPGNSIGLNIGFDPSLTGTLVASLTNNFTGVDNNNTTVFTGRLVSSAWSGDSSNTWGGLTFTYHLLNDLSSLDSIGEFNLTSFSGFQTDVSLDGSGVVPLFATRSGFPVPDTKIEFILKTPFPPLGSFQDNLLPGQITALLIIRTDAPYYDLGNAAIINGGTANTAALIPALAVPEPTALSLAALGLIAALAARKSRA